MSTRSRGGSRFSRGGGGFSKNFRKFCRPFFWVEQSEFPSSPKALKRPCFGKIFCAAGKNLKNRPKKTGQKKRLRNPVFFWRALPPPKKFVYIGAVGAFTKILRSVTKYGYLKIVQWGALFPPPHLHFFTVKLLFTLSDHYEN